jgi:hypothetical protein
MEAHYHGLFETRLPTQAVLLGVILFLVQGCRHRAETITIWEHIRRLSSVILNYERLSHQIQQKHSADPDGPEHPARGP